MANMECMHRQLAQLWKNVKCLGETQAFPKHVGRDRNLCDNHTWLRKVSAVDLMAEIGSRVRVGSLLNRDT